MDENFINLGIHYVGGVSRNLILGLEMPTDRDICGNFSPMEVKELLSVQKVTFQSDKTFSLSFLKNGLSYDFTSFRADIYKNGHFPVKTERVKTPREDFLRRDFTINALYVIGEKVLDFCGGEKDLKNKIVREVTTTTLASDGLRILRMLRFASTLSFGIDEETLAHAIKFKENLNHLTNAKAIAELKKIASGDFERVERFLKLLGVYERFGRREEWT